MPNEDQVKRPLSTREIRTQLPKILKSFREQGDRALPVVVGAYKRRDAVLVQIDVYEMLLDMAETGRRLSQERLSEPTRLSSDDYLDSVRLSKPT